MPKLRNRTARDPASTHAWILGNGLASLASAFYLIRHGKLPASNVHILESHHSMEQVVPHTEEATRGCDLNRHLHFPVDNSLKELLTSIPSSSGEHTVWDEIQLSKTTYKTRFMVAKQGQLNEVSIKSLGLNLRGRLNLILFICQGQKRMGRRRIQDILPKSFFQSHFWAVWSTRFGFLPCHSASEFKRTIRQYLHQLHSFDIPNCLNISSYCQHNSIIVDISLYLQGLGVDFHFGTLVTGITITAQDGGDGVSSLNLRKDGNLSQQFIHAKDIVIITVGSTVSGTATGTNDSPPLLDFTDLNGELDENWLLWLEIGDQNPVFGNPYNFCTRQSESLVETFTISTQDPRLHVILESLAKEKNDDGPFIFLPDSPWKLALCLPAQPIVSQRLHNVRVMWGFALNPLRKGSFVNKPMNFCSGVEVVTELFKHLKFPISNEQTVTIPRAMPRMSATLLIRSSTDRPEPIPLSTTNIGLVGPFVQIPHLTCLDPSYDVRTAEAAVCNLMDLPVPSPRENSQLILDMLRLVFWK